jgi:quinol-cytochrome oxidoreductase complex cytochrome b subunit
MNAEMPATDSSRTPLRLYVGWVLMGIYPVWHIELFLRPVRAIRQSAIDDDYLSSLFFSIPFAALIPLISLTVFANYKNAKTRTWSMLLLATFVFVSYIGLTCWDVDYSEFPFKPFPNR